MLPKILYNDIIGSKQYEYSQGKTYTLFGKTAYPVNIEYEDTMDSLQEQIDAIHTIDPDEYYKKNIVDIIKLAVGVSAANVLSEENGRVDIGKAYEISEMIELSEID